MKRSLFLTIVAILGFIFGALLFLFPDKAGEGFGVALTPVSSLLFRTLGGMILGSALLNFMVRKHSDSPTLKAVLATNLIMHALVMAVDIGGVSSGVLQFSKIAVGQLNHLFVGIGSLIYLVRMKQTA